MAPGRPPSQLDFAQRWSEGVEYLNPDEVARDRFGDWNSPDAILKAANWTAHRRKELLEQGAGIAFETVLSTDEKIDFLSHANRPNPPLLRRCGGEAVGRHEGPRVEAMPCDLKGTSTGYPTRFGCLRKAPAALDRFGHVG